MPFSNENQKPTHKYEQKWAVFAHINIKPKSSLMRKMNKKRWSIAIKKC